jgi:hypothetical protein
MSTLTHDWVRSTLAAKWTPVASRSRFSFESPEWVDVPGAPLTLEEAWDLHERNLVFRALKFTDDTSTVVILPRREPPPEVPVRLTGAKLNAPQTNWDEDRVALLRKLWFARNECGEPAYPLNKISELMGLGIEVVRGKAQRLGFPYRKALTAAAA